MRLTRNLSGKLVQSLNHLSKVLYDRLCAYVGYALIDRLIVGAKLATFAYK